MMLLPKIFNWVKEVVHDIQDAAEAQADRDIEADKELGRQRIEKAAQAHGRKVDMNSIKDLLDMLREEVGAQSGFSGDKEFRRQLALDLGVVKDPDDYIGSAGQNTRMLTDIYIMVGQGNVRGLRASG